MAPQSMRLLFYIRQRRPAGHRRAALPFCDLIIEDELHVLRVCPKYHAIRSMLPDAIKTALFTDVPSLFDQDLARRVSQYVEQIFKVRFPKNPTAITVANQWVWTIEDVSWLRFGVLVCFYRLLFHYHKHLFNLFTNWDVNIHLFWLFVVYWLLY